MDTPIADRGVGRRTVLAAVPACIAAGRASLASPVDTRVADGALVEKLTGHVAKASGLVHLDMPAAFSNGYSVPMTLAVDSPMTEADHIRRVQILAPKNPFVVVADFHFTPQSGRAAITTRIRLAQSQSVLAVAERSDGSWLMAATWVDVDIDGCK